MYINKCLSVFLLLNFMCVIPRRKKSRCEGRKHLIHRGCSSQCYLNSIRPKYPNIKEQLGQPIEHLCSLVMMVWKTTQLYEKALKVSTLRERGGSSIIYILQLQTCRNTHSHMWQKPCDARLLVFMPSCDPLPLSVVGPVTLLTNMAKVMECTGPCAHGYMTML